MSEQINDDMRDWAAASTQEAIRLRREAAIHDGLAHADELRAVRLRSEAARLRHEAELADQRTFSAHAMLRARGGGNG